MSKVHDGTCGCCNHDGTPFKFPMHYEDGTPRRKFRCKKCNYITLELWYSRGQILEHCSKCGAKFPWEMIG